MLILAALIMLCARCQEAHEAEAPEDSGAEQVCRPTRALRLSRTQTDSPGSFEPMCVMWHSM